MKKKLTKMLKQKSGREVNSYGVVFVDPSCIHCSLRINENLTYICGNLVGPNQHNHQQCVGIYHQGEIELKQFDGRPFVGGRPGAWASLNPAVIYYIFMKSLLTTMLLTFLYDAVCC